MFGQQKQLALSAARKALLWWFDWPGNPYVSVSATLDFSTTRDYLAALNAAPPADAPASSTDAPPPVSVHHLVVAAVARLLTEFPIANARIIAGRIIPQPSVGVVMPVNLLRSQSNDPHKTAKRLETTATVLERVETLTLRQVAAYSRRMVASERSGRSAYPLVRHLTNLASLTPYPVLASTLSALDALTRVPILGPIAQQLLPFTTGVSNVGGPLALPEGALMRAAAVELPQRLFHIGTLWGISAIQDEVFAIGGQPCVRPALPVVMVFDHRLFDGVTAGRLLIRLAALLRDPASTFGPDGHAVIGR